MHYSFIISSWQTVMQYIKHETILYVIVDVDK